MRSHSTTSPLMRLSLMPEVRMSTRANRNRAASAPAANASASTTINPIQKRLRPALWSMRASSRRTCAEVTLPKSPFIA